MHFTLEALQADHGDALLLHWGSATKPRIAVIDGGPDPTYRTILRPRLQQLAGQRPGGSLDVDLLMISHIDDDHIEGVQRLLTDVARDQFPEVHVDRFWFNSFDEVAAPDSGFVAAASRRSSLAVSRLQRFGARSAPVMASVPQGRKVAALATTLGIEGNPPFRGLVQAPARSVRTVNLDNHLELTIVGPNKSRLDQLQEDWANSAAGTRLAGSALAYVDDSIANLSSIVVLARSAKKTMLLTGDARGDDILAGLRTSRLLADSTLQVNLLKVPHHGSDRNVETDFFRAVHADHYVISADGKDNNPELATLAMITDARRGDQFTIHFTNRERRIENWFARNRQRTDRYTVRYRRASSPSIRIDLRDPLS